MEFLILGPVEVVGPGGAVAIGGSRERVLLARLLLSANQVVSSERLVDDLWEGEPTDGALPALQVYVSRLRKALRSCGPDDVVVTRAPGYLLRVASGDLDATRFEALLSDARRQLASGGHEVASVTLRGALALWRGRALAEVADMPFARAEAARLEEARLAAVEERIEADLACGRHAELIGELAALVSEHPLRERLWAQRMLALYRVGRQAEALRAYQDLRRFLGEQLGIEPSAALSRLEAGVLRQDPELDWPPAGHPIPPAPPPTAVPLGSHAQERFVTAPPAEVSSAAPAGVVTFLFTDLVGSTELLQQLGDDTADELRRRHFRLLREAVSARGGNEVKSLGDGLMVAFASPLAAVGCAVAVQQAVERDNRRHSGALAVRVGLHAGEPLSEDDDYFGTPVVVAKRLCDRAEGGQILASALVRALVGSRGAHTFCDLGDLTLKGLDDPVAACEVVWSVPEQGEVAGQLPLPVPMQREESFPVVGRSGELERLEVAWKEASSGQRSLVLVAGEPGIGKTRLAFEAARRAHGEGAIVLFGRCDEGLGVPYQPFVEALSTYVRQTPMPALGRLAGELVRLVPDVTDRVDGLPPPLCSDPETERYRLFDAVAAWLAAASETAPVVLVVDDLHWATRATLFLLRHLVRSAEQLRLLVVVTYRDTEPDFAPEAADATVDLLRRPGVARIALCGLDEAGVEAFMESRARHELDDDARALARVVHGETAGNPFFVGQVFRHLAETGAVVRQAGRWVAGQPDAEISIPDDVRDVVGRRLAHLPEETRDVLTLAAVAGERFELATLVTAARMPEASVVRALDPAVAARLVTEVPGPGLGYRFIHALVRATLYEVLPGARRAALHRRMGKAIEAVHGARVGDHLPALARHFVRAAADGDVEAGVLYATRAGDRAMAQLAHGEAALYYQQALALWERTDAPPDQPRRLDLLISLGEAQRGAGDVAYRHTLFDAARLAQDRGDGPALARAALATSRGGTASSLGSIDAEVVAVLESAVALLDTADSPLRARLLANLAVELAFAGDRDRCARLSDDAVAVARRLDDPATLAAVLVARFVTIWEPGTLAERLAATVECLAAARRAADPNLEAWGLFRRGLASLEAGEMAEADACWDAYRLLTADLGLPVHRWLVAMHGVPRSLAAGRIEEAERSASACHELALAFDYPDAAVVFAALIFPVRFEQGRLHEVEALFIDMVSRFPNLVVLFQAMLAFLYCELDRDGDASEVFERLAGAGIVPPPLTMNVGLVATAFNAATCAHLADRVRAPELHDALAPFADQLVAQPAVFLGSAAHYLGLLATTLEHFDEAESRFTAAEATHARLGAPGWAARTRLEWARMLLARGAPGDPERARELAGQALASASELGMARVAEQARVLLAG